MAFYRADGSVYPPWALLTPTGTAYIYRDQIIGVSEAVTRRGSDDGGEQTTRVLLLAGGHKLVVLDNYDLMRLLGVGDLGSRM